MRITSAQVEYSDAAVIAELKTAHEDYEASRKRAKRMLLKWKSKCASRQFKHCYMAAGWTEVEVYECLREQRQCNQQDKAGISQPQVTDSTASYENDTQPLENTPFNESHWLENMELREAILLFFELAPLSALAKAFEDAQHTINAKDSEALRKAWNKIKDTKQ